MKPKVEACNPTQALILLAVSHRIQLCVIILLCVLLGHDPDDEIHASMHAGLSVRLKVAAKASRRWES